MPISCPFLPIFYEHHQLIKAGQPRDDGDGFARTEEMWMSFYGLGKFETYQYIYGHCKSIGDFQDWIISLKGETAAAESAAAFDRWTKGDQEVTGSTTKKLLSEVQWQHWREQGYIRVSGLVNERLCDSVSTLIAGTLNVDLARPATWYNDYPGWHGLMLQLYQDESIHAIRTLPTVKQVFAELYDTPSLIANTEKVSFNPPETESWKFRHSRLHWDINFSKPDLQYIQGLVYLNDVPEDRGPLTVVPGFHHQFEDWMKAHPDPEKAQHVMESQFTGVPVPGKKGDLVLWLQTLPHAASANHSRLPRFVQYVSFSKC